MFTGIIEEVGRVRSVHPLGGGLRLRIAASFAQELRVDQSVSVSGACQTVVAVEGDAFEVVSIEETLRKTNLGALREGASVNLERAMRPGDRLDGHLVQGHVDATGILQGMKQEATSRLYRVQVPREYAPFVIEAGSIALDGISLTVARLEDEHLSVAIIPHTLQQTAIEANWRPGAAINLEFDMLGKYAIRWMETRFRAGGSTDKPVLDEAWLREQGF